MTTGSAPRPCCLASAAPRHAVGPLPESHHKAGKCQVGPAFPTALTEGSALPSSQLRSACVPSFSVLPSGDSTRCQWHYESSPGWKPGRLTAHPLHPYSPEGCWRGFTCLQDSDRFKADILGQFSGLPFSSMPVGLTFVFF